MKPISRPFCRTCYGVYILQDPPYIKDHSTGKEIYASDVLDDDEPAFTCVECGSRDIGFESE